jgi:hypothetical protein
MMALRTAAQAGQFTAAFGLASVEDELTVDRTGFGDPHPPHKPRGASCLPIERLAGHPLALGIELYPVAMANPPNPVPARVFDKTGLDLPKPWRAKARIGDEDGTTARRQQGRKHLQKRRMGLGLFLGGLRVHLFVQRQRPACDGQRGTRAIKWVLDSSRSDQSTTMTGRGVLAMSRYARAVYTPAHSWLVDGDWRAADRPV